MPSSDAGEPSRWSHIGRDELVRLWKQHAPTFVRLDDTEEALADLRVPFLTWLEQKGVDLGAPSVPKISTDRFGLRLKLDLVAFRTLEDEVSTRVALSLRGHTAEAVKTGVPRTEELIRLPAATTLEAVCMLLPVLDFQLERAYQIEDDMSPTLAVVVVRGEDPHDLMVGACRVTTTAPEASAKAALDAINRRAEIAASLYLND